MTTIPHAGRYFQFPIAAIQFGVSPCEVTATQLSERLHTVIDYCVVEMANDITVSADTCEIEDMAIEYADRNGLTVTKTNPEMLCAAERLNVSYSELTTQALEENHKQIDRRRGGEMLTRVGHDIFWRVFKDQSIAPRRFITMLALNAAIGDRTAAIVRKKILQRLCIGYSSDANLPSRIVPPTERQVRTDVEWLIDKGFFYRASYNYRDWWYMRGGDGRNQSTLTEIIARSEAEKRIKRKPSKEQVRDEIDAKIKQLTSE